MDCELWSALSSFIALYLPPLFVSFHTHLWHSENVENRLASVSPLTGLWVCVMFLSAIMRKLWFGAGQCGYPRLSFVLDFQMRNEMLTLQLHPIMSAASTLNRVGVKDFKLDLIVTTRVHQPLSYLRSLTISDMPGGPCFLHHTEWFMLSPESYQLCVFKREKG